MEEITPAGPDYYHSVPISDISGRERADACPGALQAHTAADGLLARVRVAGGAITAAQLRELADCGAELGSGVIELTSRANLQVRGLRSTGVFATRMAAAGLLPSATHERVRNIVASPLSGRGIATSRPSGLLDTDPLVTALDLALCARPRLAELPGRFLFALDDGTGDVAELGADVTLTPDGLLLAGLAVRRAGDPVPLLIAAAAAFLDERAAQGGTAWRVTDLEDGPARIAHRLGAAPAAGGTAVVTATGAGDGATGGLDGGAPVGRLQRVGVAEQRDGRVALAALVPLGRLSAAQARAIADAAALIPSADLRLTPWRTVVFRDLTRSLAARLEGVLHDVGLVTDPASPWAGVTACTGRPGCAKALADVQEDARRWVASHDASQPIRDLPVRDAPMPRAVHWAGCERRCGRPRGSVLDIVATADGYRLGGQSGSAGGHQGEGSSDGRRVDVDGVQRGRSEGRGEQ